MIPDRDAVVRAFMFFARRHHVTRVADAASVGEALALAHSLAAAPSEEPAALFFAFVLFPEAFPGLHAVFAERFAVNHAAGLGLRLEPSGLRMLHRPIASGT